MSHDIDLFGSLLAEVDFVSFDIFDTLLSRKVAAPVDIFDLVRSHVINSDFVLNNHDAIINYPHLRRVAEHQARVNHFDNNTNESEVSLDEIYYELHNISGLDLELCSILKDIELRLEASFLYVSDTASKYYEISSKSGKSLALISDMYLPKDFICRLLLDKGINIEPDMVFISGEIGFSKHTGNLFEYVSNKVGVKPGKWLHVGDNLHADVDRARERGISTFLATWSSVNNIHIPRSISVNDYSVSSLVRFLETKQAQNFFPDDKWAAVGYKIFGPLMFGYMSWLAFQYKSNNIEKALFMARDAQLIYKVYKKYFLKHNAIDIEYIYGSRQSMLPLSMTDWPMHRIWYLFSGKTKRSVRDILSLLGLDVDLYINDIHHVGLISPDEIVDEAKSHQMHWLINKLYMQLMHKSLEKRSAYKSYFLEKINGFNRIALVDIGWSGNIQSAFVRAVVDEWTQKDIRGFYLGLLDSSAENISNYSPMKGWITSFNNKCDVQQQLISNGGVEILEFVLTADHGSTLKYDNLNGKVVPVLESLSYEAEYNFNAMSLQSGIFKYFEDNSYLLDSFPLEALLSVEWMTPFLRFIINPTKDEAEMFGNLTHSDTTGGNQIRQPIAGKVTRWSSLIKNKKYYSKLNSSYWKSGFMARNS